MNSTLSSRISHVLVFALLGAMSLALSGCDDDTTTTTDSGTHDGGTDGDVIDDGATGDGGDGTYSLGGTVTGLSGSLELKAVGGGAVTVSQDGAFAFDGTFADGTAYDISITSAPGIQTCIIANGVGAIDGADVSNITVTCEDLLFFMANDGTHGDELWVTDGTEVGTRMVKDIATGNAGSFPIDFTSIDGVVYFSANDADSDRELWRTDGTEAGTTRVANLDEEESSNPGLLTAINGKLIFTAGSSESGNLVWVYDGTNAPTRLGGENFAYGYTSPVMFNGKLYFAGDDGQGAGMELWSTDGTTAGTTLVKDLYDGAEGSTPTEFGIVGGSLVFACDAGGGHELCITDGTEAGTRMFAEIRSGGLGSDPSYLRVVGGVAVFFANDGTGLGIWKSDGTESGTEELTSLTPSSYGYAIVAFDRVFYSINEPTYGSEPWVSDGTMGGTHVLDVVTGSTGSVPYFYASAGDLFCFRADDEDHGGELWCSDGTQGGTALVKDINPSGDGARYWSLGARKGHTFFFADDGTHGSEPWVTDGTETGTFMLKDINSGSGWSEPGP